MAKGCFGQFPLPYNGHGEPSLPEAPTSKPLGFECYQAVPVYTAGAPFPRTTVGEWRPVICHREGGSSPSLILQQLVVYWVHVGGP